MLPGAEESTEIDGSRRDSETSDVVGYGVASHSEKNGRIFDPPARAASLTTYYGPGTYTGTPIGANISVYASGSRFFVASRRDAGMFCMLNVFARVRSPPEPKSRMTARLVSGR